MTNIFYVYRIASNDNTNLDNKNAANSSGICYFLNCDEDSIGFDNLSISKFKVTYNDDFTSYTRYNKSQTLDNDSNLIGKKIKSYADGNIEWYSFPVNGIFQTEFIKNVSLTEIEKNIKLNTLNVFDGGKQIESYF